LTSPGVDQQAAAMSQAPMPKRKLPLLPLAVIGVVFIAAVVLLVHHYGLHELLARAKTASVRGIEFIREFGAGAFFLGMAILPAVGIPLMAFTIPAGQAFAQQLGMGGVIAISLVAVAINLALGYWVSRYALRPVLTRLLKRYGYSVPRVTPQNAFTVTLLVRLTPGPPYALQACLLGLAEVPFRVYMVVSWIALLPWVVGAIVLGEGIFSGKFGRSLIGLGVLIVAVIVVQWVRHKYLRRKTA
jgi:uncharacterized membrane protein YdjX (TVP38/TMEM64 family)